MVADGGIWVERQQKSLFFSINFCFINIFLGVFRRGEQGLVTETPRGEIQIPQRSGKMVADTVVLDYFFTNSITVIYSFSSLNFVFPFGCGAFY